MLAMLARRTAAESMLEADPERQERIREAEQALADASAAVVAAQEAMQRAKEEKADDDEAALAACWRPFVFLAPKLAATAFRELAAGPGCSLRSE